MSPFSRREVATNFLKMAASGEVRKAYELYVAPDFKHHNAYFKGDRQSLMEGMEESAAKEPNKEFEIKRVLEDKDGVAIYSSLKRGTGEKMVVVHIMRFEGEKIVEMWDVGQMVPPDSPNENLKH